MDRHNTTQPILSSGMSMEPVEDLAGEVDEPPDEKSRLLQSQLHTAFGKADPAIFMRRESLLTRQLHSETEHTDEEDMSRRPLRAGSTWSNPSVASTAELTSDDGHSVASPAISPPLPPTHVRNIIPITDKPLAKEPQIMGQEEKPAEPGSEQSVEAGLGRKRCISFACGNKEKKAPTSQPAPSPPKEVEPQSTASPPKRKCMLKFVCPTRAGAEAKPLEKVSTVQRRPVSPPPQQRRTSKPDAAKSHRGSDSTVTHVSPRNVRKSPAIVTTEPTPTTSTAEPSFRRKLSNDSDMSTAATRFHEFASSEDEPEEWVQESTCHRSRLTVSDTLKKENIIRKACEEVEEEAVEEEEEEQDDLDDDDEDADDDDEENDDLEAEEESDDGFRTDDEDGFAESDSEGEESDDDWDLWRPGALSTAATSIDHLDRLGAMKKGDVAPASSVGSASSTRSGHRSPRSVPKKTHRKHHKLALPIHNRSEPVGLPDSTDFVCGTLDEDRPLEQAYINHMKEKEAAKHKARPQDIDPSFPTSDPEMDEEDDEDLEDSESENENLMHGDLDELGGDFTARRRAEPRPGTRTTVHRSPPPPVRHRSPAPGPIKRQNTARSPPPPVRRSTARSPPPRKLFGHSPKRARSPAPVNMMTSPPNTRRASPSTGAAFENAADLLASRPQLTHTASLPRGGFMLGKLSALGLGRDDESEDITGDNSNGDIPKRGAIDIFKGLEKKRQRRKEKLYQKACAKAAAKGEKAYKVKPGKGAERMRELGLELQRYHGKGILSM